MGPLDFGALQRVVHRLGDGEELVAAVNHLPFGIDADGLQQGDVGREQLGDPTAVRSGIHVQHTFALQGSGQLADTFESPGLDDLGVVVEILVEQGDAFEQGAGS